MHMLGTGEKGNTSSKQMNTKAKHAREPDRFFFCPRPAEMCAPQKRDRGTRYSGWELHPGTRLALGKSLNLSALSLHLEMGITSPNS